MAVHRLYSLSDNIAPTSNLQLRYKTTTIDTVVARAGEREFAPMRWGLVPSWWKKPLKELKLATFNARVETVAGSLETRQ